MDELLLLQQFRKGEETAFKTLFERFYHPLCSYASRLIQNTDDVDDMVQDTFLALWTRHDDDFDSMSQLTSYLFVSIHNACVNRLKHLSIEEKGLEAYRELQEEEVNETLIVDEFDRLLEQWMLALPTECRRIVQLSIDGYKNQEIADMLQVSIQTVKNQKVKGYKILRTLYAQEYMGELTLLGAILFDAALS